MAETMQKYRVLISYEFGGWIDVEAQDEEEAEETVREKLDKEGIGEDSDWDCVHRDWQIEEIELTELGQ